MYDLVSYNHTLYRSVFIEICPIVSFNETPLTHSVFTIHKIRMITISAVNEKGFLIWGLVVLFASHIDIQRTAITHKLR